ncbi:(2Fe-2S)-binding protein [Haloplasma contractile]|uniref:BFD--binding domain-containing protein n=1 Tax=Haloplasma contractile SSD-17B TaxID=1033810 RepID=F7PW99_9MOLU|nr:(2Fe-2S)-binding protein [Haloplasma contractile]ERJ11243.1 BFD--binding domain-containing protein [Haloplasma contractile SSD-17B]
MDCCDYKIYDRNKLDHCPHCNTAGEKVKDETVTSLIITDSVIHNDNSYYLCLSSDCDVAYFDNNNTIIPISKLKVPIWFKKNSTPKYMCYCSKVTEDEVIDAIFNKNCRTVKDIVDKTNAMNISNCIENSPTGKCCSRQINDLISKLIDC